MEFLRNWSAETMLFCQVKSTVRVLLVVGYFVQFCYTMHRIFPSQVLERSMDLHTCAVNLTYEYCVGSMPQK